jgi:prepilin-type N-terminal cleavage/methylation domain-containing protein
LRVKVCIGVNFGGCCPGRSVRTSGRGFTLLELLVSIGIISLLMGILLVGIARARRTAGNTECIARLRHIGGAFTQYALENGGRLPDPWRSESSWEVLVSKYLPSNVKVYQCPADQELAATLGSSYDWRDTGVESTTLAGRRLTDVKRGGVILAFESLPGWHARRKMNVVRLDGSTATVEQEECMRDLAMPVR